ncbi:MAG: hypothetical protein KTR16_03660 [Acidiferrobacterales bacterium]|nr:hypothetical protein [Acidiferrobacterales bacterium]
MRNLIKVLILFSIFSVSYAGATEVTSLGQAVSLCRAEAMTVNDDFVRSKSTRLKETRSGFNIKLKVYLSEKSVTTSCEVQRDGTLSYSQE